MTTSPESPEDPAPRSRNPRRLRAVERTAPEGSGQAGTGRDRPTPDSPDPETPPDAAADASAEPGKPGAGRTARRKSRRRRRKKSALKPETTAAVTREVAPARVQPRHWGLLASFALLVLLPFVLITGYLYTRAADQYHSEVAFSIRSEEAASAAAGLLGALTQVGSGSASDADILYEYIRSQRIVEDIDADLDLRAIYNAAENDPVFTLGPDATIEQLLGAWQRKVDVNYDSSTGIIHVVARAFDPESARIIATEILERSDALVNQLSEQAREDAVRFAREELEEAEEILRGVRKDLADFRRQYNLVDPTADVASQAGMLNALQQELAQALVDRDVLLSYAAESDQRVVQANRRITAITDRLEEERSSLDLTGLPGSLPDVVGRYEELLVNMEFANTAFTQTLAGLGAARAEARRQSRYLAAHIQPTEATSALYPRRFMLSALSALFLLLGWSMLLLVYYNVRDNR